MAEDSHRVWQAAAMAAGAAAAAAAAGGSSTDGSPGDEAQGEDAGDAHYGDSFDTPPWNMQPGMPGHPAEAELKGVPSKGSEWHGTGRCRPCAWFWKQQGCQSAGECKYCHLCPEGELKSRKKLKVAAMRMGALTPAKQGTAPGAARALKLTSLV